MATPNATKVKTTVKSSRLFYETLNALTAPAQRPIIILPQYIEIQAPISEDEKPPNSSSFTNSPRLLQIATSTPTYLKIASIPNTNCGYFIAPQPSLFADAFL